MALKIGLDLVEVSKVRRIFERDRSLEQPVFTALGYRIQNIFPFKFFRCRGRFA